ncbi:hypothetical protein F383_35961 [Gossypium arboreum]|uniref:Uncharacterized protein n=1 Tax=Gossypium arboreum TaxID=29729 RepID=A0A0B0ND70_GOSAR|nr:hypothetical protein F383_35961 [Gossypium arboreum]
MICTKLRLSGLMEVRRMVCHLDLKWN